MTISPDTLRFLQHENARLTDENQHLREEITVLRKAIHALINLQETLEQVSPESDVIALIYSILSAALDAVDSDNGSLLLRDEETNELVFVEVLGPHREELIGYRMPAGEGVVGWSVANRKPLLVPDASQDSRFSPLVDKTIGFITASLICVPLLHGERALGAIEVVNTRSGKPFRQEDLEIMQLLSHLASLVLVQAEGSATR
ncbi:MAG: GAF domain-containing protein [Chloroflexota bacterium]